MRVYLTGFMGAGKTTVGRELARKLECSFVDLDEAVEAAAGKRVRELFASVGESGFRRLEADALRRTHEFGHCVVATGGGTPIEPANRRWMRQHGTIVWLSATFDSLRRRVNEGGERPLWGDEMRAQALFYSRLEAYGDCDLEVDASSTPPDELADEIAARLGPPGLR